MRSLFAMAGVLVASSAMATSFFDDFNRADSANLGANWANANGTIGISGNMAQAPSQSPNLATVNGYSDTANNTAIEFDVFHGQQNITYAAAVLGYLDLTNSIFIKVQDNGLGNTYNRAFFYIGNGGAGGSAGFQDITTPFANAHIKVSYASGIATLGIDADFNGSYEQVYTANYGAPTLGTGAGLGAYGDGKVDNYAINGAVPEPTTVAVLALGALALIRRRKA